MNVGNIDIFTRVLLFIGVFVLFSIILFLIKKQKLSVKYSLIWLFATFVLFIFALFPYIILVLTDITNLEVPINFVFTIAIAFILLLLLSLSSIVSGFANKIRILTQQISLLENRIRELEDKNNDIK